MINTKKARSCVSWLIHLVDNKIISINYNSSLQSQTCVLTYYSSLKLDFSNLMTEIQLKSFDYCQHFLNFFVADLTISWK